MKDKAEQGIFIAHRCLGFIFIQFPKYWASKTWQNSQLYQTYYIYIYVYFHSQGL